MGMVTLHIVIGVGVFILPLFLLLFTVVAMELAHVYIIIGSISFIASVLTSIVLVTKFINQPAINTRSFRLSNPLQFLSQPVISNHYFAL